MSHTRHPHLHSALFASAAALLLATATTARALDPGEVEQLRAAAGPDLTVRVRTGTGLASLARLDSRGDLLPSRAKAAPTAKARAFFARHGNLFGVTDPDTDLALTRDRRDRIGMRHLRYDQRHAGHPVFGGQVRAHFDAGGALVSVAGSLAPVKGPIANAPQLTAGQAHDVALADAQLRSSADLSIASSRLVVFHTGFLRGRAGTAHLAWEVEIVADDLSARETLFVDAGTGDLLDRIDGIQEVIRRRVSETSLTNVIWDDITPDPDPIPAGWAGGTAQQVTDWQNEIDGAVESYNLIGSITGGAYLSYDGADSPMRTVNNDPGISCPNASWNGVSTNYCSGVTADDIVGHEWIHGYTQFTHGLIYQWQSGALNESYSDIFGEIVDFLNGRGSDTPGGLRDGSGASCSTLGAGTPSVDVTYRWLTGEDSTGFGGAIRDMWRPECYGDPGRVGSSDYWCSTGDNGGVHINSGIPNHAFALLVDGGTYNGQTITAVGLDKTTHIYWRAATVYQTPASGFEQHADALEQSCADLIGVSLDVPVVTGPGTWGTPLGSTISAADCVEVADAIAAVELRTPPSQCGFQTLLDPNPPALCAGVGTVETIDLQDFESGLGSWSAGTREVVAPGTFDTPDWAVVGSLPDGRSGSGAFVADDPTLGDCATDIEAGVLYLESPTFVVPNDRTIPRVAFDHWVATEAGWDGANVKVSVNAGPWTLVPGSAYDFNAYNDDLNGGSNDNPLATEEAFTGTDGGLVSGSWGQSQIDLSALATAGDQIQLRFELGIDGCFGAIGWYVDDIHAYTCSDEIPATALCGAAPAVGCLTTPAGKGKAILRDNANDTRDLMKFVWTKGEEVTLGDLGAPDTTDQTAVCFYDGIAGVPTLVSALGIEPTPAWKSLGTRGWRYRDSSASQDGVKKLLMRTGADGKSKVVLVAKGVNAPFPTAFSGSELFDADPEVVVQIVSTTGTCWESRFGSAAIQTNVPFLFRGTTP